MFTSAGAGEEVPADRGVPQHEGDPDQEERADQGTEETAAEVASPLASRSSTSRLFNREILFGFQIRAE